MPVTFAHPPHPPAIHESTNQPAKFFSPAENTAQTGGPFSEFRSGVKILSDTNPPSTIELSKRFAGVLSSYSTPPTNEVTRAEILCLTFCELPPNTQRGTAQDFAALTELSPRERVIAFIVSERAGAGFDLASIERFIKDAAFEYPRVGEFGSPQNPVKHSAAQLALVEKQGGVNEWIDLKIAAYLIKAGLHPDTEVKIPDEISSPYPYKWVPNVSAVATTSPSANVAVVPLDPQPISVPRPFEDIPGARLPSKEAREAWALNGRSHFTGGQPGTWRSYTHGWDIRRSRSIRGFNNADY